MGTLPEKLMAFLLSKSDKVDEDIYGRKKTKLFSSVKGKVLEIGPGTGVNFKYYTKKISWIGIEPNKEMHKFLNEKIEKLGIKAKIKEGKAEKIPLKDSSIDFVISTLVLCSIDDQVKALSEIKRVLKKGGKLLFIEHVADKPGTLRKFFQDIAPHTPWRLFSDNCRPNRETWSNIRNAGFSNVKVNHFKQKESRVNPIAYLIRPHIIGEAIK